MQNHTRDKHAKSLLRTCRHIIRPSSNILGTCNNFMREFAPLLGQLKVRFVINTVLHFHYSHFHLTQQRQENNIQIQHI